ncbi:DNA polymerase IV [Taklimakanibacter deserti]|uniref:DNA polymerase IV n=1 Tax=Taklimakanibacter deserti TaxID=2267839 RepID=UPI000E64856B
MDRERVGAGFCRDCFNPVSADDRRCSSCRSPRLLRHPELHHLTTAHLDCDAFYAAIEKRDDPSLRDRPVIVGVQHRGVVSTACYIARIRGVRSAMPMFQALKLCPDATVIPPNMAKYAAVGQQVRELMLALTPLVQPLSIDEAFLDLAGTERLHGRSAAYSLALLGQEIEREIGITVSVGLSHNKFLAKMASDLDKPRGFSVIGRAETLGFLAAKPVSAIWGVGKAMQAELAKDGITMIAQLQTREKVDLMKRYGTLGARLYHLSRGEDARHVSPDDDTKSISAETTFDEDISDYKALERILWQMSEKVSRRAKADRLAGSTVTLKLKTADFKLRTRAASFQDATVLADRIFSAAQPLLKREATGTAFRLLGVGISHLREIDPSSHEATLDERAATRAKAEHAIDRLREKFGRSAVERGLVFNGEEEDGA